MEDILAGRASDALIAGLLTALRIKGETVDEVVGFAKAMRRHATQIFPRARTPCGIAGRYCRNRRRRARHFNISTAAAFVIAGAGVRVAKHGNRSFSSQCGSADVLESLGAKIDLAPAHVARAIEEIGIGFMFAPAMHAATRHAMPVRRELRMRTVFNLLGPLTNPAGASVQIVGVYEPSLTELVARALGELGVRRAFVFHGADGLDEISISGDTCISELRDGAVRRLHGHARGFRIAPLADRRNSRRRREAQRGNHSPHFWPVVAPSREWRAPRNRAREFCGSARCGGRATDFLDGVRVAAESIDSGAAREKLEAFIAFTQREGERALSGS